MNQDPKFPIGKFEPEENYTLVQLKQFIQDIKAFPAQVKSELFRLGEEGLETPYRDGGWTARQVIHHCADSHFNSFMRFKLALTEDTPTIKPYHENLWAEQIDYSLPVESSLMILEGLHQRWVALLENLESGDLKRTFYHPEMKSEISLERTIALYSWHCRHHLGHLKLIQIGKNI
ncbi:YfiT family bacillithiol transferase [Arthrospiribacter ruber]|uniref:Metal-dependent hydrolase n=1 Tax=Arthrospiribacter ruber TaxID=2487934 RepID=A0A951IWD5_9BACT|nr:putative metal-dependent hydrolase [Arthrospiribacter ruber]MBW3468435.1 putative metal-dependent hydrolase [Arthrospiribacter ruber]